MPDASVDGGGPPDVVEVPTCECVSLEMLHTMNEIRTGHRQPTSNIVEELMSPWTIRRDLGEIAGLRKSLGTCTRPENKDL